MFYVYILKSLKTERFYIGSCKNINNRLQRHNSGQNKSTKNGVPWLVIYQEIYHSRQDAVRREMKIKSYKGGEAFKRITT